MNKTDLNNFKNKIILGDSLEVLERFPDKTFDLVFTDVPYKQEFHGRGMAADRINYQKMNDYGSNQFIDYEPIFNLCIKKLNKINFFTFCNKETKFDFICLAKKNGFNYQELCFCKTSPTPFINNQWLPDVEYGIHIFKSIPVLGDYSTKRSFFIMDNFKEANINHPSPKKVDIVSRILKNISSPGDFILDCFSGSGTTAIACDILKRDFVCIEKDAEYHAASVQRLEDARAQLRLF